MFYTYVKIIKYNYCLLFMISLEYKAPFVDTTETESREWNV